MVLSSALSANASATRYDISSKVAQVRYHVNEETLSPAWQGAVWISLETDGVASQSDCGRYSGKLWLGVPKGNDQVLAVALSGKAQDAVLKFTFDDAVKTGPGGTCLLQYISWD